MYVVSPFRKHSTLCILTHLISYDDLTSLAGGCMGREPGATIEPVSRGCPVPNLVTYILLSVAQEGKDRKEQEEKRIGEIDSSSDTYLILSASVSPFNMRN